ncbi:glycerol kinase GlpK [Eilatimonas milleporae]|uniref:glycerol kinase n=1 Tax=Eilatimonas milleporae TaxID=911205 RepID=A0A3M0CD08_9PROT|nr:glycerol kinase GlpK [Eilatimonas milleporae]RMB07714.1 glycerol kinase [Eilatimonas milleporae]
MDTGYLLSLDQGTTSTRALAVSPDQTVLASAQKPLEQHYPHSGWVEHDAEDIWQAVVHVLSDVVSCMADRGLKPLALGITNQRETTILWERGTGTPLARAIVWQDRRTAPICVRLGRDKGVEATVTRKTGLVLDPYFSATKLAWLLDDEAGPGLRASAERGDLCFGTVESYLAYRLTGGGAHVSDAANASRTMLLDIRDVDWSDDLLRLFGIPCSILPDVVDNTETVGVIADGLPAAGTPIAGLIGDQQAAAIGQGCIHPGMIKSTYGTGCFVLQNTGDDLLYSQHKLLSTIAYKTPGGVAYAMEGSIFNAGTVVQWFRDQIGLIASAQDSEDMVAALDGTGGVYMVPAFTGLGAPHWDPDARGLITGLSRATTAAEIVRAGLESVVYQTADLFDLLQRDGTPRPETVRIDGGMAANGWFARFLADICDVPVERPASIETTALGAALAAGVGIGLWPDLAAATAGWRQEAAFSPAMSSEKRGHLLAGWQAALRQCLAR